MTSSSAVSDPPRVSVVMPVHDVEPYVRSAIETVLAQTFSDIEVIVIDDGSTDRTAEIVLETADPRIRLHRTDHGGLVAAENRGIELASGEYIVRCDGDDLYLPTLFERQVEVLDREPGTAAVGAWVRLFGGRQRAIRPPTEPSRIRAALRSENCLSQPVMMRAEAVRAVGGFRPVTWEDWDLWIRLAARYDLRNIPECLVLLRSRASSAYWSFTRIQVRRAKLGARWGALRELGAAPRSIGAIARAALAIPAAALLDRVAGRSSPSSSSPTPPDISVVVPTYRRPALLERCLRAVQAQDPAPREVVVAYRDEDAETAAWLAIWREEDPERRRTVAVNRPGLVHALARGTEAVRSEAVAYLDDDAVPRPGWLRELGLGFLDPSVGAVGGRIVDHVDGVEIRGRTKRLGILTGYGRVIGRHHLDTDHYGDVNWLTGANVAVRTSLARHDERLALTAQGLALGNDLDTCLSVLRRGFRVLYTPWAVVEHHTTSYRDPVLGSRVGGEDVVASAANHTYVAFKHLPAAGRAAALAYGMVVGSSSLPAPVRALAELLRSPARARAMTRRIPAVWRGRRLGVRMWRQWRTAGSDARRVEEAHA
jgi:glycosyltransferase involved in cell wall biosynthesis